MLAPCYLVHGGEPLQTTEIIAGIRTQAAKEGYNNSVVLELTSQFKWEELLNRCQNLDLFAERTLIELRLHGETVSKQGTQTLEAVFQEQDPNLCILITAGKLKATTLNANWARHIHKDGKVLVAKPIAANQWTSWVSTRLKQAGFNSEQPATAMLAKCYEGNLLALAQLIQKISLALPKGDLTLEQITPFIDSNTQFSIFELVNAALAGERERTFTILNSLKDENVDPILTLWALARELRQLLTLKRTQHASSLESAAQKLGIWRDNLPRIKSALERLTTDKLEQLLQLAQKIDTMLKGMQPGDAWQPLTSLSLALATNHNLTMEDLYT